MVANVDAEQLIAKWSEFKGEPPLKMVNGQTPYPFSIELVKAYLLIALVAANGTNKACMGNARRQGATHEW